ncbi:predicted protein [Naegleria gruberi]|uniref:Predicted protein n=1 Tax=Naegleria gruberi TaxID=5762 RepID=D2W207_NAEGR|nr:uncharacterized protein NAEGRDRAFT_75416 [Naegleria gruberi]EFC36906.1 predicted protein [Naegleria gruberi]|eukprot:XP_002669650.1 predicted protein [Naegleria gruberi strain NEG-M]
MSLNPAQCFQSVPEGFHSAVDDLNRVHPDIINEMSHKTVMFILGRGLGCYVDDYQSWISTVNNQTLSEKQIENVINLLLYIFRTARQYRVPLAEFPKLLRSTTQIQVNKIKVMCPEYEILLAETKFRDEDNGENTENSEQKKILDDFELPRLKHLDWKLSISTSSSDCEDLQTAKVTVTLLMTNSQRKTIDLSLSEFKKMYSEFSDMAGLIDSL